MLTFKNYTSIVQKGWSQNENGSKMINDLDSKKNKRLCTRNKYLHVSLPLVDQLPFELHWIVNFWCIFN
jgi:hypothetical protein